MSNQGTELVVAETWLVARIAAAQAAALVANPSYVTLRVHNEFVPQSAAAPVYPCIVFRLRPTRPRSMGGNATVVWANLDYLIEVIGLNASFAGLAPYVSLIDQALHAQGGSAAGGRVVSCINRSPFKLAQDAPGGGKYQRLGNDYRLEVQATED